MGDWDWHICTLDTMYKIDNKWENTVYSREVHSVLYGELNGKEIQKREEIYIYIYVQLIYFAGQHKLTWRCKATIVQYMFCGRWEGGSRGRGRIAHLWLIHVDVWQKSNQYCKAIIFQLNLNELKKIRYGYLWMWLTKAFLSNIISLISSLLTLTPVHY